MILPQHGILGYAKRYSEVVLTNSTQTNFSGTTTPSISVTPATDGRLMIITVSGPQNRTVTPPAGWSSQLAPVGGSGTCKLIYRIASGESGTYNFTLSGTLTPGVGYYYEFSGIDRVNPFVGSVDGVSSVPITAVAFPSYNADNPGAAVTICLNGVGTSPVWTVDSGFTLFSTPSISRIAHKIYTNPQASELVTWSGGTSGNIEQLLALFRAEIT